MRVMVIVKATAESEAGTLPTAEAMEQGTNAVKENFEGHGAR